MLSASMQVNVSSVGLDGLPGLSAMLLPVLVLAAYELGTRSSIKAYREYAQYVEVIIYGIIC